MRFENCKVQNAKCKMQIVAVCVIVLVPVQLSAAPFTFDDIEFWVGYGANRAAIVIDWHENATEPAALAWGYRWEGNAYGRDMLMAVAAADDRLFAKFGNSAASPVRVYGLGYDVDDDGDFGACDVFENCTEFDDDGLAYSGEIFVSATATDTADEYREGWATGTGFWHYGIPVAPGTNPYSGGSWSDIQVGMATRKLVDGDWDSWVFQLSTTPPFNTYAENPVAAAPPFPRGDFNRDTVVDALDYTLWRSQFGSTTAHESDANHNGVVDAADYTIWRNRLSSGGDAAAVTTTPGVPEPSPFTLVFCFLLWKCLFTRRKELFS
jgi:Dockerin type I domain